MVKTDPSDSSIAEAVAAIDHICASSLQLTRDPRAILELTQDVSLWTKLKECLLFGDPYIRKRATFIINLLVSHDSKLRETLSNVVLVLETLEETQGHIIRPVLNKIHIIHDGCMKGSIELCWLYVIFQRFLSQESKMISRWGMQLLLDLPVSTFLSPEGTKIISDILKQHLSKTYLFYRPAFQEPGSTPPVAQLLLKFLREYFSQASDGRHLFGTILELLSSTKLGFIPLTMISHAMKNLKLDFVLRSEHISILYTVFSSMLATKPENVRKYVKECLLAMVAGNLTQHFSENAIDLILPLLNLSPDISPKLNTETFTISLTKLRTELQKLADDPYRTRGISSLINSVPRGDEQYKEYREMVAEPLRTCATNVYMPLETVVGHALVLHQLIDIEDISGKEEVIENIKVVLARVSETSETYSKDYLDVLTQLLFTLGVRGHCVTDWFSLSVRDVSEQFILRQLGSLVKSGVVTNIDGNVMLWIGKHLTSPDLPLLESAWLVVEKIGDDDLVCLPEHLHSWLLDAMDRVRDAAVLETLFKLSCRTVNEDNLESTLRAMWTVLQDATNTARFWVLLRPFCDVLVQSLSSEKVFESITQSWIEKLLDIANTKDSVYTTLVKSLSTLGEFPEDCIDMFVRLSLFGGVRSREKKNREDLQDFLGCSSSDERVCASRIRVIACINQCLKGHPEYAPLILERYLKEFFSFERPALMNSVPNRFRIRIWQCLLCLLSTLMESLPANEVFEKIMSCFDRDSQPSVRCLIECGVGIILETNPILIEKLFSDLEDFDTSHSNAYVTAAQSIVAHFLHSLQLKGTLTPMDLNRGLERVIVWTSANNHNIRTFAGAAVLKLTNLYKKQGWEVPTEFTSQIRFISTLSDYQKTYAKLLKFNKYFSEFNNSTHLTLFNIFAGLPSLFGVLEDELLRDGECPRNVDLSCPVDGPRVTGLATGCGGQEVGYLISWKDVLVEAGAGDSLQKKITPWQLMASSLDLKCKRSSHGELIVFASFVDKATNLGGLSRTSEIFGVRTLVVNSLEILNNKEFKSLSLTSEKWLEIQEVTRDLETVTAYLKHAKEEQGYTIVGIEQATNSVPLQNFKFPARSVLVLGREKDGVPAPVLDLLDVCVEIPQTGVIRSLNVHVTGSIAVWEYTRQVLDRTGGKMELQKGA